MVVAKTKPMAVFLSGLMKEKSASDNLIEKKYTALLC
jgi:hypothetical protein